MGMFDIECPICGANFVGPLKSEIESGKAQAWIAKNTPALKWLDEAVIVLPSGPIFGQYDFYGRITDGKNEYAAITANSEGLGYALHQACWELAGKPSFEWLKDRQLTFGAKPPFDEFAEQFFDWDGFIEKGVDLDAALDPRHPKGVFSKDRIMNFIKEINSRNEVGTKDRVPALVKKGYVINPKTGRKIKIGGPTHAMILATGALKKAITVYLLRRADRILGVFDSEEKAKLYAIESGNLDNSQITPMELNRGEM